MLVNRRMVTQAA